MKELLNKNVTSLENSLITEFSNRAKKVPGCLYLTIGQPDFPTPNIIKEATINAINDNQTSYSPTDGIDSLKESICKYEKKHNQMLYHPNQVIVTVGATEAIYIALTTLLTPNDEVIVPTPYYPEYKPVIELNQAKFVTFDTTTNHYQLRMEELEKVVTKKTKCLILTSPNNPTGTILDEESIDVAYQLVKKYDIFLLLDNCYEQLYYNHTPKNFANHPDIWKNLIICQSFSKPYAMTGWRLGYLLGEENFIKEASKLHQYITVSVNTFIQHGALTAFSYQPTYELNTYQKRRDYAYNRLIKMGLSVEKPDGAFYLFPSIAQTKMSSLTFCTKLLEEQKVAVTPGIAFGKDDHFRICYCVSEDILEESLNRLDVFLKSLKIK